MPSKILPRDAAEPTSHRFTFARLKEVAVFAWERWNAPDPDPEPFDEETTLLLLESVLEHQDPAVCQVVLDAYRSTFKPDCGLSVAYEEARELFGFSALEQIEAIPKALHADFHDTLHSSK